jgi:hypothetical protein
MRFFRMFILFATVALLSSSAAGNEEQPRHVEGIFGLKAGVVGSGEIGSGTRPRQTGQGLSLGVFADQSVSRRFSLGFRLDFDQLPDIESGRTMVGVGLVLKTGFPRDRAGIAIRPGIGIGYAYLGEFIRDERVHFFTVQATVEVLYFAIPRIGVLLEAGAVAAPIGGTGWAWITADPRIILRAGIVF